MVLLCADPVTPEVPFRPRLPVCAREFGAGLGAFVVCAGLAPVLWFAGAYVTAVGLYVTIGFPPAGVAAMTLGVSMLMTSIGAGAGSPAGCALMVSKVGDAWNGGGSRWGAIGGAYIGLVPGAGIAYAGRRLAKSRANGWFAVPFYVLGVLCVPLGSTVGYNLGIYRFPTSASVEHRFDSPHLTFTWTELPDCAFGLGVKLELVSLRF
jgi:hypothetical protein